VRFGGRTAELFPTPLLVAEFGPILEPEGSLLADIDGDGEEAEELIPFVWIPGGTGRFIFEDTGWVVVADGAILFLLGVSQILRLHPPQRARSQPSVVISVLFLLCPSNGIQAAWRVTLRNARSDKSTRR
jgi:hypothetical protein